MKRLENYLYVVLIYALLFWLLVGCRDNYASVSFVKVESERIEEFQGFLSRSSFQWEESKDQPSPKGRPPFNMHTITIKHYSHLGFSGELNISFFNNRLISTTFYPADVEKYIEAVVKAEGLKFDNNQEAKLPPHTRVRFAVDHKGRKYVDWSDIRLDKEVELWIKRYS
jgi:hypothetical protein